MAQFVFNWSIFFLLTISCLTLSNAKVLNDHQHQHRRQQDAQVSATANNDIKLNDVNMNPYHLDVDIVGEQVADKNNVVLVSKEKHLYHPIIVSKPRIIDQYAHRTLDGQYEYRYLLNNFEARYERAYWMPVGKSLILARKGYYSHLLDNNKYLTVFYTADQNGYHEDSSTYSQSQPNLPRSLKVSKYTPPFERSATYS